MSYTYYPNSVIVDPQGSDEEIDWKTTVAPSVGFLANRRWSTVKDLTHIANPATGDIRSRTKSLICTDFKIETLPEIITGLKVDLVAQRNGRVADEIIQLTFQGELIGTNNFNYYTDVEGHLKITNETSYGSETDTWGTELTPEMLRDPSFGLVLKFQAHPFYPHRSTMYLNAVSLTVF